MDDLGLLRSGQRDVAGARRPDAVGRRRAGAAPAWRCTRWRWPASPSTRRSGRSRSGGCSGPATYVGAVTFGTRAEADRAAARVRGVHRRVRGVEPESGTPYRATDPDLLLWVHCGEIDSFLTIGRRAGVPGVRRRRRPVRRRAGHRGRAGRHPARAGAGARWPSWRDYFERIRPELRRDRGRPADVRSSCLPPMPALVQLATPARVVWAVCGRAGVRARCRAGPGGCTACPGCRRPTSAPRSPCAPCGPASWMLPAALREPPAYRAAKERLARTPVRRLTLVSPARSGRPVPG